MAGNINKFRGVRKRNRFNLHDGLRPHIYVYVYTYVSELGSEETIYMLYITWKFTSSEMPCARYFKSMYNWLYNTCIFIYWYSLYAYIHMYSACFHTLVCTRLYYISRMKRGHGNAARETFQIILVGPQNLINIDSTNQPQVVIGSEICRVISSSHSWRVISVCESTLQMYIFPACGLI